jgi:tetratricopeptide (TPR) repeat protein
VRAQLETTAFEALRLADGEPGRAWALGSEVSETAARLRAYDVLAIAERARGLAALHLSDLDAAHACLTQSLRAAKRTDVAKLVGEARMSLAFVLNRRGETRRALREVEAALNDLDGVERARALAQRAAILQQLGRWDDALAGYRLALPALRDAGDLISIQRVLSNRAVVQVFRSNLAAAEADLLEARQLCSDAGLDLQGAFVEENLGFVATRRGDVPAALRHMDEAERRFRALGTSAGSVLVDRAELLLAVRLVNEARETAEQAVREFTDEGRQLALPEAQLLLASATLQSGDADGAVLSAREALNAFTAQGRRQFAVLARFGILRCLAESSSADSLRLSEVVRTASALLEAGWGPSALEAHLIAARLATQRDQTARAEQHLRIASGWRRRGPAAVRATGWYAEALVRRRADDRNGASRAIAAGLRILDEHRASFGATELRAHVSGHRQDLTELGLRIAMERGNARGVLRWAERGRATHLLLRPIRPPDDDLLAGFLVQLRAVVAELENAKAEGTPTARLLREQIELERRIRDHTRRQDRQGGESFEQLDVSAIGSALTDAALVEYVELDKHLWAIVLMHGRVQLRQLCPTADVYSLLLHLPFALRRLGRDESSASPTSQRLQRAVHLLQQRLLDPLLPLVGDRSLVVVPTGQLQSLPWSLLPACSGRPVSVAPSAAVWLEASRRTSRSGDVLLASGPQLPGARREVAAISRLHPGALTLMGDAATAAGVTEALGRSCLAHISAHGHFRAENPLFSSLRLADGPLTVYDLEALEHVPGIVILAACDSAQSLRCAGDELLGLTATFLSMGSAVMVGTVMPIPDAQAERLMLLLHHGLLAGRSVADALAAAQQALAEEGGLEAAAAAGFVCLGAGDATLPGLVSSPVQAGPVAKSTRLATR